MLYGFDAGPELFRSGWFVESLATQTLVIFVIRTRRVPFFRSRPSRPLLVTTLACAAVGILLPYSPLADVFGFEPLPAAFLGVLAVMVLTYLALVEAGKYFFYRRLRPVERPLALARPRRERRVHRVASACSHAARITRVAAGRAREPTRRIEPPRGTTRPASR